jgi:hypothetical protein
LWNWTTFSVLTPTFFPRIADGAYYEAHQQLRTIAVRYIKQSNYDAAADLLAGGATALLRAGAQQGASASGGDLAIMLVVEVYNKAEWEISGEDNDTEGRARKSMSSCLRMVMISVMAEVRDGSPATQNS